MAVITGMSSEVAGQNYALDREEISIGRSDDNTIVLDDAAVSARHCSIVRDGEQYVLRDLGSTNGTRVNSREIKEVVLQPRDLIQVGGVEFMFKTEHSAEVHSKKGASAQVEVAPGPAAAPESFDSISPFGTRSRDGNKGMWYVLIGLIGLLALIAVGYLFVTLFTTR